MEVAPSNSDHNPAIIAEMTTAYGPGVDDHFVVLVSWSGSIRVINAASAEVESLIRAFGGSLEFTLGNCTEFASQIMYPLELKGRPLFNFVRPKIRWSLKECLRRLASIGSGTIDRQLTEEIVLYLAKNQEKGGRSGDMGYT